MCKIKYYFNFIATYNIYNTFMSHPSFMKAHLQFERPIAGNKYLAIKHFCGGFRHQRNCHFDCKQKRISEFA